MTERNIAKGFTLVEILIVVVILGILAAIVIPQFTNASQAAKASSLQSQLQTIRSQLELFQLNHNGVYPTLDGTWAILTNKSSQAEVGPLAGSGTNYGPYLQQPPVNPFTPNSANATAIGTTASAAVGWVYTPANGAIKASVATATANACNLNTTNDVDAY
jgi:general secretion pathway protein G